MVFFVSCCLVVSGASARDGFVVGRDGSKALEALLGINPGPRVGDLAVGERGYISAGAFCRIEDGLAVPATVPLEERTRFLAQVDLLRDTEETVSLSLSVRIDEEHVTPQDLERFAWSLFGVSPIWGRYTGDCQTLLEAFPNVELYRVTTVDGYRGFDDWSAALRSGTHPHLAPPPSSTPPIVTAPVAPTTSSEGDTDVTWRPPQRVWTLTRRTAQIDDSPVVSASLVEEWPHDDARFVVACQEGETRAIFDIDTYLMTGRDDRVGAEYRLDQEIAQSARWSTSVSRRHAGHWGMGAVAFLRELLEHESLYVRVTERNGAQHDAEFDLTGLEPVVEEVAAACGWNVPAVSADRIRQVQRVLRDRGLYAGAIDGLWGPMSRRALSAFQRTEGLDATGVLNTATLTALEPEMERQPATPPAAADSSPTVLDNLVDPLVRSSDMGDPSADVPELELGSLSDQDRSRVMDALRACWRVSAGPLDTRVRVRATMRPDGTVDTAQVLNPGTTPLIRMAEEAALRAVLNPVCQPWPLPPDRYADWRFLTLEFVPRDHL